MDNKLISKRELLQRYGISYGALYRWKRMGLIPEDWFIKKSTSTGQETFFVEDVICQRIELILGSKDSQSLEELAKNLKPKETKIPRLVIDTLSGKKVFLTSEIKEIYLELDNADAPIQESLNERNSRSSAAMQVNLTEMVIKAMRKLNKR